MNKLLVSRLKFYGTIIVVSIILLGTIQIFHIYNVTITGSKGKLNDRSLNVKSFAVYYGSKVNVSIIRSLNNYSIVILQPDVFSQQNLSSIKSIKIAYIDLGEYDAAFPNYLNNSTVSSIEIGYDYNWSQPIINISSRLWVNYIREEINYSIAIGFNGILFDDLDVVQSYPQEFNGFINIIRNISQEYPNEILIVNRGFSLIPFIHHYIQGVLYEDFGTFYNFTSFSNGNYSFLNNSQLNNLTSRIRMIKSYGLFVLGLGYSPNPYSSNDPYTKVVEQLGVDLNVPTYVSNVNLNYINLSSYTS